MAVTVCLILPYTSPLWHIRCWAACRVPRLPVWTKRRPSYFPWVSCWSLLSLWAGLPSSSTVRASTSLSPPWTSVLIVIALTTKLTSSVITSLGLSTTNGFFFTRRRSSSSWSAAIKSYPRLPQLSAFNLCYIPRMKSLIYCHCCPGDFHWCSEEKSWFSCSICLSHAMTPPEHPASSCVLCSITFVSVLNL